MGGHIARPTSKPAPALILALIVLVISSFSAVSFGLSDAEFLLRFRDALSESSFLTNWNLSRDPCTWNYANWAGVICSNGSIWGLKLEHMGLAGTIDIDSLSAVSSMRTLSLMDNKFDGPLPIINKMGSLKALYLSNNYFSGKIADNAFEGMNSLKKLYMANNRFTGSIPSSLVALSRLQDLRLEANQFDGKIPEFNPDIVRSLNLANNQLEGPIPANFSKMDASAFAGNKNLCGPPLNPCVPSQDNMNQLNNRTEENVEQQNVIHNKSQKKENSILKIVLIVIVVGFLLGIFALAFIVFYMRTRNSKIHRASSWDVSNKLPTTCPTEIQHKTPEMIAESKKKVDYGKLTFLREDIEKFDLQDMLKASAEVLGSGTFGASYKTVIATGQAYVVKRYKQMNNVGREDFQEHMRRLGRLTHPNLLPLTAFYYRKEEKLLVYEFVQNGSLASKLHANQRPGLDWNTRLKIIKGVAKGMGCLHTELPSTVLPHGHLKSSNVLLDRSFEPLLTDYALRPVINPDNAHNLMVAYKSPEYADLGKLSKKADVWSLGILILELLTGKFPENYLLQGYSSKASLSSWVNNMVKDKRTSEVFDKEMRGAKDNKSEMINLLKIGLSCCEEDVQTRLDMKDVVEKILQLKEGDIGEDHSSKGYVHSITGNDDDFSMKFG